MAKITPPSDQPTGGAYTPIFANAGTCVGTVRDFVVVGGLSSDRYGVQWCAIGDPTDWPTPGTDDARAKQAGSQTFPSKFGWVLGVAGNDFFMYVFQQNAITKGTYVGGDVVFSFDTFEEGRGLRTQGMMAEIDDLILFQSDRGYHALENDQIADIGHGIVDDSY
jgi:hypothetical protein